MSKPEFRTAAVIGAGMMGGPVLQFAGRLPHLGQSEGGGSGNASSWAPESLERSKAKVREMCLRWLSL